MKKLEFPVKIRDETNSSGIIQKCWLCSDGRTFYGVLWAKDVQEKINAKAKVSSTD